MPRPRSLHLPSALPKQRALVRKPHLSKLHLDTALRAQAAELPHGVPATVPSPFVPPVSPQIPSRRRPAFSPGGFGLTSKPAPRAQDIMGLGRPPQKITKPLLGSEEGTEEARAAAAREIERRDREFVNQERLIEGVSETESEAEACYIVSGSGELERAEAAQSASAPSHGRRTPSPLEASSTNAGETSSSGHKIHDVLNKPHDAGPGLLTPHPNSSSPTSVLTSQPPPTTLHYHSYDPLPLVYSPTPLPPFQIAYETWGTLNAARDNAIILHTGLSASSHVASGGNDVAESTSSKPGWWEDFVGPGKSIDTDRFFVICTNVLGGCFGSTGPSSPYPPGDGMTRWATRFPLLSIHDMSRAQLSLLDYLGIDKVYASIGSSMGGMTSLSMAYLAPERVGRVASISATGRSGLGGVGMRYAQRSVLMADPNWNRGFYYDGVPPHEGMKLARQIATITYRSGPEWEQRFGRRMLSQENGEEGDKGGIPRLSPDFLIETYLDHQGERFCLTYDANSLIYLSKAMDLFDMTAPALRQLADDYNSAYPDAHPFPLPDDPTSVDASRPRPNLNAEDATLTPTPPPSKGKERFIPTSKSAHLPELAEGLQRLKDIPALVLGVQSDILFDVEQQRALSDALKLSGNRNVTYYELGGVWGHDTFLLDVQTVGGAIRGFLH